MKDYIIHLFKFEIDTREKELFDKVGEENFDISINNEEGTLLMSLAHNIGEEEKVKVFEIYKNVQSYDIHRASDQFKHYIETVGHVILKREMIDLKAHIIVENAQSTLDYKKGDVVELTKFEVEPNFENTLAKVERELIEELKSNDDLLAFYLMSDLNSNSYYIYKVARAKTQITALQKLEKEMKNSATILLESDKVVSRGRA